MRHYNIPRFSHGAAVRSLLNKACAAYQASPLSPYNIHSALQKYMWHMERFSLCECMNEAVSHRGPGDLCQISTILQVKVCCAITLQSSRGRLTAHTEAVIMVVVDVDEHIYHICGLCRDHWWHINMKHISMRIPMNTCSQSLWKHFAGVTNI